MKSSAWLVSPLTADDLPAIFAIEKQTPSPWTPAQLEGEFFGAHGLQLACRHPDNNQLGAFIMARMVDDEAEILKIATNPADRRQGAACCLLGESIKLFRERGAHRCHLELRAANTPARLLYEKFDFIMTGLRKNYYSNPKDDALCMTLALS
ncbi:MAG: ribosomal protein S18-alanine N-acetyltransferase [Thermodesulfobacteriota bacterium]